MMAHNIPFKGVIWKIIPKLHILPLLICSTAYSNNNIWNIPFSGKHLQSTDGLFVANNIRQLQRPELFYPEAQKEQDWY